MTSLHRRAEVHHRTQSESVMTLGPKEPIVATRAEVPKGALLTTPPVVVETTLTQAPCM
jgi:hypothetical protein